LCLAFAQFTYREGLRDIEACLRSSPDKLYHMGIRGRVSRSTLADANEKHDWHIFADFAQILIQRARGLYADDPFGVELQNSAYALDSTTIDLCLAMFPWARFREQKGAVKVHTLIDLHGNIPVFVRITDGKVHDVNILDQLLPEAGAFYVMDRGYLEFPTAVSAHRRFSVLRDPYQRKRPATAALLSFHSDRHRREERSDRGVDDAGILQALSGGSA
jgi:hypothetical protein